MCGTHAGVGENPFSCFGMIETGVFRNAFVLESSMLESIVYDFLLYALKATKSTHTTELSKGDKSSTQASLLFGK